MAVLHHSKPRGDFLNGPELDALSLEAQIVRVADAVAYLAHDIGDAVRAGVLGETDLPTDARELLGSRHSQRIDTMVRDIVTASWDCAGYADPGSPGERPRLAMSPQIGAVVGELREFMFDRVYVPAGGRPRRRSRPRRRRVPLRLLPAQPTGGPRLLHRARRVPGESGGGLHRRDDGTSSRCTPPRA